MSASSGKAAVTSRSLRLWARTRPPSTKRMARTPSHLISKAQAVPSAGSWPDVASIGLIEVGRGSARVEGPCRWIIQLRSFVWNRTKPPDARSAVEDELHLGVGPLLDLVVALVPDGHPAAAVLAPRDFALEGGVLERVVLGVHGEMVLLGRLGEALGERPGDEDPVALEP